MKTSPIGLLNTPKRQRGAVLTVGMIFLAVLTVIGVSALSSTELENRMSTGFQERGRALQVAETGIAQLFNDLTTESDFSNFDPESVGSSSTGNIGSYGAYANLTTTYLGETTVLRTGEQASGGRHSSGWGAVRGSNCAGYHHFRINSVGSANNNAMADISRGIRIISRADC